jgi:Flp pilus assembly pilin Flp
VTQWLRRRVSTVGVWFQRRTGNVFIENGIWIIIVVLAMILPIEALRNALIGAFGQITNNLNAIP